MSMEAIFKEVNNICASGEERSCFEIQEPGRCFLWVDDYRRASYVFNAIYQRNPSLDNCIFGGLAFLINIDPSTGSCVFQTSTTYMTDVASASSHSSPPPPPPPATITPLTSPPPPATTTPFTFWISVAGIATVSVGLSIGVWRIYRCYQNIEINIEM